MRRSLMLLTLAGALAAPRGAAADCSGLGPFLGTGTTLPLGCPVHVYFSPGMFEAPRITALRAGQYADVTGTTSRVSVDVTVTESLTDCQLRPVSTMTTVQPYADFLLQPTGVAVGEQIGIGSGWVTGIEIVAAGPCAAPILPAPTCSTPLFCPGTPNEPPFFEDDVVAGGCAAGGGGAGGGLLAGLLMLGSLRGSRRALRQRRRAR